MDVVLVQLKHSLLQSTCLGYLLHSPGRDTSAHLLNGPIFWLAPTAAAQKIICCQTPKILNEATGCYILYTYELILYKVVGNCSTSIEALNLTPGDS